MKGPGDMAFREWHFVLDKKSQAMRYYENHHASVNGMDAKGEVLLRGAHVRTAHDKERKGLTCTCLKCGRCMSLF